MVKAKEAKEAVSKFTKKIACIINRAIKEACSKKNWPSREDISEKDLLKIWDEGQSIKDGAFSLRDLQNFSDKDLEDLTRYFKDEEESDKYLGNVIKKSTGIENDENHKKIYREIMIDISGDLNEEWRTDYNLCEYDELDVGEIIAFYFLHSFKNQMLRVKNNPGKDADNLSVGKQKELDQLLDEHNFVLIQSHPAQIALWGKEFLKWFSRQEGRSYTIIDWEKEIKEEEVDLTGFLAAVPSREREIMKELKFDMNFYGERKGDDNIKFSNSAENIQECFKSICFPDKFLLIIDGFDGSSSLLEDLHMFAEENGGQGRFKIVILPLKNYDEVEPTFHISQLDKGCLRKIFEDYAKISLRKEEKTAYLVDRLCENASYNPEMMVLFGEAFKNQMEMDKKEEKEKDIEFANGLLKFYLAPPDKKENKIEECEFHSRLHRPGMKLFGHIKSIYEKYIPLNKGTLAVLFCVQNIPIPEKLAFSWFAINSDDLEKMQSIGWCKKNGDVITISMPLLLTKVLVTNKEERKQATDALDKFRHKFEREIRNGKSDSLDAEMQDLVAWQMLKFPISWLVRPDDSDQHSQEIQMFRIYCIRNAVQCGDAGFAKELIESDKGFLDTTVGKAWKCIIDLNGLAMDGSNPIDKELSEFEDQYLKLLKNGDIPLETLSNEELLSFIEMTQEFIEITLSRFMLRCKNNGLEATDIDLSFLQVAYTYAGLKEDLEREVNERFDYTVQKDDCFKPMIEILNDYYKTRTMTNPISLIEGLDKQFGQIKRMMDGYLIRDQKLLRREKIKKVYLFCDVYFILLLLCSNGCPKAYYELWPNLYSKWKKIREGLYDIHCEISEGKKILPRKSLSFRKSVFVNCLYLEYIKGSPCPC